MSASSKLPSPVRVLCISSMVLTAFSAAHAATLTTIHNFSSDAGGISQPDSVILGPGGVLYGTTLNGGQGLSPESGTVFRLTPPSSAGLAWSESVYFFPEVSNSYPQGERPLGLVMGPGNAGLYGTTESGGQCGHGTVFELTPPTATSSWVEDVLFSVCLPTSQQDLIGPDSAPVIGPGGVIYVTLVQGPERGEAGAVLSLSPPAASGGAWTETVLTTFSHAIAAESPVGVTVSASGALYGGTGTSYPVGYGAIYSLTPPGTSGGNWTRTILHDFSFRDGDSPNDGILIGSGGILYGTTIYGGRTSQDSPEGCGIVYSLTPAGSSGAGAYSVLYRFTNSPDGATPTSGLTAFHGILYGTTLYGGRDGGRCTTDGINRIGCGTIFSLTPPASPGGPWTETVLYEFTAGPDGYFPYGRLTVDRNGVFYGVTTGDFGTVFAFKP